MCRNLVCLKSLFRPEFALNSNRFFSSALYDNFGRKHDYLRISLVEKCNLRCRYCMPEGGIQLNHRESYINLDEIKRLVKIFVGSCEVKKIRLTGGEPTIDPKLIPLLRYLNTLKQNGSLETIAITTNGLTLKTKSGLYSELGVDSINVSLDTMKPKKFEYITRRKGWNLVHEGLMMALKNGFKKIKLNCVVMRGFNDDELIEFANFSKRHSIEVRFIEFMPFEGNQWSSDKFVATKEMLHILKEHYPNLARVKSEPNETSSMYRDGDLSIGFISSITDNFCGGCNRIRLTSDGFLKVCLLGREEVSLRDLIRNGATDSEILKCIRSSLKLKKWQHSGIDTLQKNTLRPMIRIGNSMKDGDFTHLDSKGQAKMVNIEKKIKSVRVARATGRILVGAEVLKRISDNIMEKGDVLTVAKIAGILGAKQTSSLIPLCHNIPLDNVTIDIRLCTISSSIIVDATTQAYYNTGVELESLTAVSIALLTIYDMCKSVNKTMIIYDIKLLEKTK